jgi:hypothetical protein
MPAYWDRKESQSPLYKRVHKHDEGTFSFSMEHPFPGAGEHDPGIQKKLQELKQALERAKPEPDQGGSNG